MTILLFWIAVAILFFVVEIFTLTFGFIFITLGALLIIFLLSMGMLADADIMQQMLIMLVFAVVSFLFFYRSFKKSKENTATGFHEDMTATVVDGDLEKGVEGRVKWSGTIFNAVIADDANIDAASVGSKVVIRNFKGNVAIIGGIIK